MECSVCGVRSSVGYCGECQAMLCEECGVTCENCTKIVCPEHSHQTRSGRQLCAGCQRERIERGKRRKKGATAAEETSFQALHGELGEAPPEDEDDEIEEAARVISGYRAIPPWQLSMYIAVAAVLLGLLLVIFPTLRRVPMGGTDFVPMSYVLLVLPALALVWAFVGMFKVDYWEDRTKCFIGVGFAAVSVLLCLYAAATDPARQTEDEVRAKEDIRRDMDKEELSNWREDVLSPYKR